MLLGYYWGYTELEAVEYTSLYCLALWASKTSKEKIFKALVIANIIQLAITYYNLIPWIDSFSEFGKLYTFGSARHTIRYSTVLFAGLIGCMYNFFAVRRHKGKTIKDDLWRSISIMVAIATLLSLYHAYSNTILALTGLLIIGYGFKKLNPVIFGFFSYFLIITICFLLHFKLISLDGFELDAGRAKYWLAVIQDFYHTDWISKVFGHGIGYWRLYCRNLGLPNLGHPHNEYLLTIYEYGLCGLAVFCFVILYGLNKCKSNFYVFSGLLLISISLATNSLKEYPEVGLIWAVYLGMAYGRKK